MGGREELTADYGGKEHREWIERIIEQVGCRFFVSGYHKYRRTGIMRRIGEVRLGRSWRGWGVGSEVR